MATTVYERLSRHLDQLPAGYPSTEDGVELRILHQLFTPEEAELALYLTLIPEEPRVIAYRSGLPVKEVSELLKEMDLKGLIFSVLRKGETIQYRIQQFVVGFWEGQVNRLTPKLVADFDEYLGTFLDLDLWQKMPQLRTIPVGESIAARTDVMPYEQAEAIVHVQKTLAVQNCICRQEQKIADKGCDKPAENCMIFGPAAERNIRLNQGRAITRKEALDILHRSEEAGLVLQTSNAKESLFICSCCGCCCGALRSIKQDPKPASRISSPFVVNLNTKTCIGDGLCVERCQMEAIHIDNGKAILDLNRCIGCGLCVSICPAGSLELRRKPKIKQPNIPGRLLETYVRLGLESGRMGIGSLVRMKVNSILDRMIAIF